MEIPEGYVGFLKSKSGLNVKHGITSTGVVDAKYTGSIVVKLYNHSDEDYWIDRGDKITQIVFLPILTPEIEVVDHLEDTERGSGGFGSTGR
jgi:dUTP pyrophosphatase